MESSKQHTILVTAQNKRGVIEKVAMLLRRKMYNVEQMTAGSTEDPQISRITITFSGYEDEKVPLIANQISKIIEVVDSHVVDESSVVTAEVALIKVTLNSSDSGESVRDLFTKTISSFRAEVLETRGSTFIIRYVSSSREVDALVCQLSTIGQLEVARSGSVALEI